MTAKCFKPLYGRCMHLDETLDKDDCALGLRSKDRAKLCQDLGDRYYTYLVLNDGFDHEIVKVEQQNGILYVERAVDDTCKQHWGCGASIKFDWTVSGLRDLGEAKAEKEECLVSTFSGEIKSGNCTVRFKDGVALESKPNKYQIPDGCYEHPVITYEDGCIEQIGNGSEPTRFQQSCADNCGQGKCNCGKW